MIFARDHEGKRYPCDTTPELEESLAKEWIERGIAEPLVPAEPEPEPVPAPTKKAK